MTRRDVVVGQSYFVAASSCCMCIHSSPLYNNRYNMYMCKRLCENKYNLTAAAYAHRGDLSTQKFAYFFRHKGIIE